MHIACRDFVAFVGAIGFTPMDFILPIILWQKVGKHSLIVSCANWVIVVFYSIIAVVGEGSTDCHRSHLAVSLL